MKKLAFIELGNMGRAICSGLIAGGAVAAEDVRGYAPHWDRLEAYARETGIAPCRSAQEAVEGADTVLITDIYAAREKDPGDIHATMLVDALQKNNVPAVYTPDFDACEAYLRAHWHPGDVVITLGCGNINQLNDQLAR